MSQMNNNIDNKNSTLCGSIREKMKEKIYLYNLYTIKISSTIGTVIYSLINKQFLRLKIFNNFLRDKQQYFPFFLYSFIIFYVTRAKYYAFMYLSL